MEVTTLKTETTKSHDVLLIKPYDFSSLDWNNPHYLQFIMGLPIYNTITVDPQHISEIWVKNLDIPENATITVTSSIVFEDSKFLYELIWVYYHNENETPKKNDLATLLNVDGNIIYGNALLMKTHMPVESYSAIIVDASRDDIYHILERRIKHKTVVYQDGDWEEHEWIVDLNSFLDNIFDLDKKEFKEVGFLNHNLQIYYSKGKNSEMEKIVGSKYDKLVITSKLTDDFYCDITLNEIKKIIEISKKLDNWTTSEDMLKDEKDDLGRKIVKNKYRILEKYYSN